MHGCHQKAVELLGLGNRALRRIPTGPDCRMDVAALADAIAQDRAAGWHRACVIATAGTVNAGAMTRLSPDHAHLLDGTDHADSLALDPHKSLHVPFETGCVLVRDAGAHLDSFALHSPYLDPAVRGIAAEGVLLDLGIQTTRAFRALKVWMMLREHGTARFGRIIDRHSEQAQRMAALIDAHPRLVRLSPVTLDIVCFRYDPGGLDAALNAEIMMRLQEFGIVAFSDTTFHGEHGLRAAICNHRTTDDDIDMAVSAVVATGNDLVRLTTHARPA